MASATAIKSEAIVLDKIQEVKKEEVLGLWDLLNSTKCLHMQTTEPKINIEFLIFDQSALLEMIITVFSKIKLSNDEQYAIVLM